MKLRWLPLALRDLHRIRRSIAKDNPTAALRWVERVHARARTAAEAPLAGRVVPEFERPEIREVFLRSYRIVYRALDAEVQVLTVFEGHRLFPAEATRDAEDE